MHLAIPTNAISNKYTQRRSTSAYAHVDRLSLDEIVDLMEARVRELDESSITQSTDLPLMRSIIRMEERCYGKLTLRNE